MYKHLDGEDLEGLEKHYRVAAREGQREEMARALWLWCRKALCDVYTEIVPGGSFHDIEVLRVQFSGSSVGSLRLPTDVGALVRAAYGSYIRQLITAAPLAANGRITMATSFALPCPRWVYSTNTATLPYTLSALSPAIACGWLEYVPSGKVYPTASAPPPCVHAYKAWVEAERSRL